MALLDIVKKGSTDRSVILRICDSTDGTPETAVAYNTSGIDLWYRREGAAKTSITEASLSALTDAHSDGGFLSIANGEYRLDLPDAAFASGANYVDVGGTVTGMIVFGGRVRLVDIDLEDTVRAGLTALPDAAADAAGGLPISDAGGLDLDAKIGAITFTVSNQLDCNVVAISDDATAAANAEEFFNAAIFGTVSDAGAAAGDFDAASGLSTANDFYNGMLLVFTSGNLQGVAREISDYVGSTTRNFAFTGSGTDADAPFPAAPDNGSTFMIISRVGT